MTQAFLIDEETVVAQQWAPGLPHPLVRAGMACGDDIYGLGTPAQEITPAPVVLVGECWYRVGTGDWNLQFNDGRVDLKADAVYQLFQPLRRGLRP